MQHDAGAGTQDKPGVLVRVEAPARLHFGFLDLNGGLNRLFGSIGVALEEPRTEISLQAAERTSVGGREPARSLQYLELVLSHLKIRNGVHLDVERAIPSHAGLGSGTQLGLAIGAAVDRYFAAGLDIEAIARILGRGNRSGIGIGTFRQGGFVVDGGRNAGTGVPPVISQVDFPQSWRFVLVLDRETQGVHGVHEIQVFEQLEKMSAAVSAELCRLLVMQILPALIEKDCAAFGEAMTIVQQHMGEYFKPAQSGVFASTRVARTIEYLRARGACGTGQSSWGPTGFALYASETDAYQAVKQLKAEASLDSRLELLICRACNAGALIRKVRASQDEEVKNVI